MTDLFQFEQVPYELSQYEKLAYAKLSLSEKWIRGRNGALHTTA
jgi:hypothetical protein